MSTEDKHTNPGTNPAAATTRRTNDAAVLSELRGVPDLPLIIEQLLDHLDEVRALLEAQQAQLNRQAARIDVLERR